MQATLHAVGSDGGSLSRAKALRRFAPLLLGFILLLPIWIVKYPPLLDYPNHLASTFVLAHMGDPSFRFAESYKLHWGPYPYLTDILILGALDRIVPPLIAGKIFLSLCVLAFPLAARFFLRWANPGERAGTLWALLGGYNYFLLLGFLNFAMSLPVCLLALGLWLRFLEKPAGRRWLAAVVGMTALYFTHLIAFAFAALVMALYLFPYRKQWGQTIISALLCLPGVAIYLSFTRAIVGAPGYVDFAPFHDKLMNFSELAGGFSSQLGWFIIAGFVVCIVMCAVRNPEFGWNKRWAGVATALLAAYWAMPAAFGQGSFLDIRVLPLFFVVLLGIFRTGRRGGLIAVMAIIAFCMQISVVVRTFHAWQPELNSLSR
ncbi:MAG: hypothetical protein ACRD50_02270, partial [Candidatus Acidiferrales bacterium]